MWVRTCLIVCTWTGYWARMLCGTSVGIPEIVKSLWSNSCRCVHGKYCKCYVAFSFEVSFLETCVPTCSSTLALTMPSMSFCNYIWHSRTGFNCEFWNFFQYAVKTDPIVYAPVSIRSTCQLNIVLRLNISPLLLHVHCIFLSLHRAILFVVRMHPSIQQTFWYCVTAVCTFDSPCRRLSSFWSN